MLESATDAEARSVCRIDRRVSRDDGVAHAGQRRGGDGGAVRHRTPGEVVNGGFTNITLAWGLAVTFGVYIAGRISGAHLNPAVTLTLAVFKGFSWAKVVPYTLAQIAGALAGASLVFFNYHEALLRHDPMLEKTAGIFTTFPALPNIPAAGFFDQVIGTALAAAADLCH